MNRKEKERGQMDDSNTHENLISYEQDAKCKNQNEKREKKENENVLFVRVSFPLVTTIKLPPDRFHCFRSSLR